MTRKIFNRSNLYLFIGLVMALSLLAYEQLSVPEVAEAGSSQNMRGYAWGENTGWLSMNSIDGGGTDFGVNIDSVGNVSGYAWSEHIGWVTFNTSQLGGCPSGPCSATLDRVTGKLIGWARALAPTGAAAANAGGWDGWISLSGSNYAVQVDKACDYNGFAWGSTVVGWLNFNGNGGTVFGNGGTDTCPPPDATFSATNCTVPDGGYVTGDSVCDSIVNWEFYRGTGPYLVQNTTTGITVTNGTLVSGANQTSGLRFGSNTLRATDSSSPIVDKSVIVTATCAPGTTQTTDDVVTYPDDANKCLTTPADPSIVVTATPDIVRVENTADIEISVSSSEDLLCTVLGVAGGPQTFTYNGGSGVVTQTFTTEPLRSAQTAEVGCDMPLFPSLSYSGGTRVSVIGTPEEI